MTRTLLPPAALLLIVLALAPSTVAGSSGRTYVSHRYHYSMTIPAGFKLNAARADIPAGWFPSIGDTVADEYTNGQTFIVIASTKLGPRVTLTAWGRSRFEAISTEYGCSTPTLSLNRISGAPAIEFDYLDYADCFGHFDTLELVHDGRGYDVYWIDPINHGKRDVTRFHADIASFRFTS